MSIPIQIAWTRIIPTNRLVRPYSFRKQKQFYATLTILSLFTEIQATETATSRRIKIRKFRKIQIWLIDLFYWTFTERIAEHVWRASDWTIGLKIQHSTKIYWIFTES